MRDLKCVTLWFTTWWIFKEGKGELFMSKADVKQDQTRGGIVDNDILNGQPNEELFLSETNHTYQPAIAEICPNNTVKVNPILIFGEARGVEEDLEAPIVVQVVRFYLLWDKPCG